jgi:hypothetical protein
MFQDFLVTHSHPRETECPVLTHPDSVPPASSRESERNRLSIRIAVPIDHEQLLTKTERGSDTTTLDDLFPTCTGDFDFRRAT